MTETSLNTLGRINLIVRLSRGLFAIERRLMQVCIGGLLLLVVYAILKTALGSPLYWASEAALGLMLFTAFLGQSMLVYTGRHPAVTLVAEVSGLRFGALLTKTVDLILLALSLLFLILAWLLFDPLGVIAANFQMMDFAISSGNFIYQEPTNTLGISKAWIWIAPVPTFITLGVHAAARLLNGNTTDHREAL
ncbi:MAG: TRAP transporter small permease [Sneathiellales bacterium]|nr:TRAP transporter small permease [Sneathiellales bacterium]